MFIASQKRRENIAEYLLYMWNVEDMIRAAGLDINRLKATVIDPMNLDSERERQLVEWYESLIDMMRREGVKEKGHIQLNKNVIIALEDLHRRLTADDRFATYSAEYYKTLPYIVELRAKAGEEKSDEIETCFNALYGLMLLRLKGHEISDDTKAAMTQMARYLGMLAQYYKKDYNNELFNDEE